MIAERIRVRGQVQGVGFRPFVWRLAQDMGVRGEVSNDGEGVLIYAVGESLDAFAAALLSEAPPLARVDAVEREKTSLRNELDGFEIVATTAGEARTRVTPDAIVCEACMAEVQAPEDRRFGYPFANCTHCGPRFSIVESVPYDRASTTMKAFEMCPDCAAEYADPADRRFHAQPIACPVCGPRLWFEAGGREAGRDPISLAVQALREGWVLAVKGLGGFHLACDALNEGAVARLRERKRRPAKPFALMAPDTRTVRRHARLSHSEETLLRSAPAPVLLLEAAGEPLAPSVAPGQWTLGWMLPTTPLHRLLTEAFGGPLVMTSGNLSGEPQVIGNAEARAKLTPFADAFLMHDREIARRIDDSVARVVVGRTRLQRRARGYAPGTLTLPETLAKGPATVAYGGQLKAAICLTRGAEALLSHHLGDLDDALTAEEFAKADRDYAALFDHRPEAVTCDLHPDYRASRHARERAEAAGLPLIEVQHHHAHIAACMAEAGWAPEAGPVIGVALDGLGLGPDGTVWGGEVLLCDYKDFERISWLRPVPLPGGEAAQREPWRNLLAQLDGAGFSEAADRLLPGRPLGPLRVAMAKGVNSPLTSSTGRLFDAVAAGIGLTPERQSFEGEAAMALEAAARPALAEAEPYPMALEGNFLDPAPLWAALLADRESGVSAEVMAARFHLGLAVSVIRAAREAARRHGAAAIALSGGCFQNATLLELCLARLEGETVLTPAETPPNDGSLALGQAAVAMSRLMER